LWFCKKIQSVYLVENQTKKKSSSFVLDVNQDDIVRLNVKTKIERSENQTREKQKQSCDLNHEKKFYF
jgi:hypothetical protein